MTLSIVWLKRIQYEVIYNRIKYLVSQKYGIAYISHHYFSKIKADSHDSIPIKKRLNLHNVIKHIKSVVKRDKNYYYYKTTLLLIFLEKCFYQ